MTATLVDLRPALNARRRASGAGPVADWGPVALRHQAIGYALARAACVYVWPLRRAGTLAGTANQGVSPLLRVQFSDGAEWFPPAHVHPIPFCLRFKTAEEIEEYLLAEERPADDPTFPGGHAA